jgi:hypothetical protein
MVSSRSAAAMMSETSRATGRASLPLAAVFRVVLLATLVPRYCCQEHSRRTTDRDRDRPHPTRQAKSGSAADESGDGTLD